MTVRLRVSRPFDPAARVGYRKSFGVSGGAEALLRAEATWWIDALYAGDSQTVTNLGTGGTALNATLGSSGTADSNDPKFLAYEGTPYVYLPGVASNNLTVPDSAALSVTGAITIDAYLAIDDWTPASDQGIACKWNTASNRSYRLDLVTSGGLTFYWSADGSASSALTSTTALTVTDGSPLWVRVVFTPNDGAGSKNAKFYQSSDGASWTQVGTTVTQAGTTSIFDGDASVLIGNQTAAGSAGPLSGKVYRIRVYSDATQTTKVLDVDCSKITSGSATSFTEQSSNAATVTINRATSGRKAVAVVGPLWLLGTDDYMEVADNDLLDFGASESFTAVVVHRGWATFGTNDALIAKKADTTATTLGWALTAGSSTAAQCQAQVGDGTAGITASSGSRTSGALSVSAMVRDTAADTVTTYLNATAGTPVTDTTTGTLANSSTMRIGRLSGAGTEYSDMGLMAAAVFRRALTAAEVTTIVNYYTARYS